MIKQATKEISIIAIILLFLSNVVTAEDKPESNSIDDISYYSTQDDLIYFYNQFDKGAISSQELYEIDKLIYNSASNLNEFDDVTFDTIDFELYTKGREIVDKF